MEKFFVNFKKSKAQSAWRKMETGIASWQLAKNGTRINTEKVD